VKQEESMTQEIGVLEGVEGRAAVAIEWVAKCLECMKGRFVVAMKRME
jgi:hypothetical protein